MEKIAVRFLDRAEELQEGRQKLCAWAGMAREGKDIYISAANISCPLALFNLGYAEYSAELVRILVGWGDAETEQTAQLFLENTERLEGPKIIHLSPHLPTPDVVVCFGTPEEIMKEAKASVVRTGRRIAGKIGGIGALCGELVALPYVTGNPNCSLGCGGSRKTVIRSGEVAMGLCVAPRDRGVTRGG